MTTDTDILIGLLKEARKIIRASSQRSLCKDWDARATKAISGTKPKPYIGPIDNPADFRVTRSYLDPLHGFGPPRTAVMVTHVPTGLVRISASEPTEHANKTKAWEELQIALEKSKVS